MSQDRHPCGRQQCPLVPPRQHGHCAYMSASIHLAVATPNCVIMEGGNKHVGAFGNALLESPLEYFPGYAKPSERPGLGVEFNQAQLQRLIVA